MFKNYRHVNTRNIYGSVGIKKVTLDNYKIAGKISILQFMLALGLSALIITLVLDYFL